MHSIATNLSILNIMTIYFNITKKFERFFTRHFVSWFFKTYDDEKILLNLKQSHFKATWSIIQKLHNQLMFSDRHRIVNEFCAKWKTLRKKKNNIFIFSAQYSEANKQSFEEKFEFYVNKENVPFISFKNCRWLLTSIQLFSDIEWQDIENLSHNEFLRSLWKLFIDFECYAHHKLKLKMRFIERERRLIIM